MNEVVKQSSTKTLFWPEALTAEKQTRSSHVPKVFTLPKFHVSPSIFLKRYTSLYNSSTPPSPPRSIGNHQPNNMADQTSDYVTLISSDDFSFVVKRSAACLSDAIKRMLDRACTTLPSSPDIQLIPVANRCLFKNRRVCGIKNEYLQV